MQRTGVIRWVPGVREPKSRQRQEQRSGFGRAGGFAVSAAMRMTAAGDRLLPSPRSGAVKPALVRQSERCCGPYKDFDDDLPVHDMMRLNISGLLLAVCRCA
jgi:hypothetical protein